MDALAWLVTWKTLKWYYDFGIRCFGMISAWFLYGFRMTSRWLLYDFWMTSGWLLDDFWMTSWWLLDDFWISSLLLDDYQLGKQLRIWRLVLFFSFFFGWLREWLMPYPFSHFYDINVKVTTWIGLNSSMTLLTSGFKTCARKTTGLASTNIKFYITQLPL